MELRLLEDKDIKTFKRDMQEAFQLGAEEGSYDLKEDEVILPESHIGQSDT